MTAFTLYWAPETVAAYREAGLEGEVAEGGVSGQFSVRGVEPGDWIYVVQVHGGMFGVISRFRVRDIRRNPLDRRGPDNLWSELAVPIPSSDTAMRFGRLLSEEVASQIRFASEDAPALVIQNGRVDARSLQRVRTLAPESQTLLDRTIDESEANREARPPSKPQAPRATVRVNPPLRAAARSAPTHRASTD